MTDSPRRGPDASPLKRQLRLLQLAGGSRPQLERGGEVAALEPPTVLGRGVADGAAQVLFLATRDLPAQELAGALPADERSRWERLTNAAVAQRFVAGRWLLRCALAAVIGGRPDEFALQYGEHGKPTLAAPPVGGLAFNLSHSGDLAALAVVRDGRVGIDVERARPLSDAPRLAQRILTVNEVAHYESLPAEKRLPTLIAAWARKEAVLKALGTGISGSPSSVAVSLDPGLEGRDFVAVASSAVPERWSVRVLAMPPGFQGALALEKPGCPVLVWQAFPVTPDR